MMIAENALESKIGELLDDFYSRRIEKISTLKLRDALKRKTPYLYRASGIQKASEIVEGLLLAYMSSSDEGIFGDAFFEPLAKFVSGGAVSPSEGVDVAIETKNEYKAIAVKSGPSVFNSQSKRKQADDFRSLEARLRKLKKHFDPIVGYCYGNKKQSPVKGKAHSFRELAGQDFWLEITGDDEFYLKIIRLMKDRPQKHMPQFKRVWDGALNRFTHAFIEDYCFSDGTIDWVKLTILNSGRRA